MRSRVRMKVELNIEELVLEGFRESEREIIAVALRKELGRLISEGGLSESMMAGGSFRLDGGSFTVPRGQSVEQSGENIARTIYARWGQKNPEDK